MNKTNINAEPMVVGASSCYSNNFFSFRARGGVYAKASFQFSHNYIFLLFLLNTVPVVDGNF